MGVDDPGLGRRLYLEAHIPGMVLPTWNKISRRRPAGLDGTVPDAAQFAAAAGAAGGAGVQVVAYATLGGASASGGCSATSATTRAR